MVKLFNPERLSTLPSAVLFDTDNTLYPYKPAHKAAMDAVKAKVTQTFSISDEQFERAFKEARNDVKNRLKETASSHSRLLYFQRMLEMIGLGSQVLIALDFEQTYWRTFLSNAVLFDGVKSFLDDLRLAEIPTAIVTDLTAQIQFRKIVYFGLDHYFDYIVTSEEAGFDKPHSAPFEIAVAKLKPTSSCVWMIGDNPQTDIWGGREAIQAVTFQKIHTDVQIGNGESTPDMAFSDFTVLSEWFRELVQANEQSGNIHDRDLGGG